MNHAKWDEFDHRLTHRLSKIPHVVDRSTTGMGAHYDRMAKCIADTITEVIPNKKTFKIKRQEGISRD